jgi:hypothetical protein
MIWFHVRNWTWSSIRLLMATYIRTRCGLALWKVGSYLNMSIFYRSEFMTIFNEDTMHS